MEHRQLDELVRGRTSGRLDLAEAVSGYLRAVNEAASVLGVRLDAARLDRERGCIEVALAEAPALQITWTPFTGWVYREDQGAPRHRVASRGVAAVIPDADNVAAWFGVLANGHRPGHGDVSRELAPEDGSLAGRLIALGEEPGR